MTEFEYWYVSLVIASTAFFCTVFVSLHTHVWVRKGYEGLDEKLDLMEIDRFVAHVMSEVCLVFYYIVVMIEPLVKVHFNFVFPTDSKAGFVLGFIGSAAYMIFRNKIKGLSKD
jgi:hypothetical protein